MEWYENHSELMRFARFCVDHSECLPTRQELLDFFATPWDWTPEHTRWVEVGRPDGCDPSGEEWIEIFGADR